MLKTIYTLVIYPIVNNPDRSRLDEFLRNQTVTEQSDSSVIFESTESRITVCGQGEGCLG